MFRRKGFIILGFIFGGFLCSLAFLLLGNAEFKKQPNFGTINAPFSIVDFKGDTISSCDWNDKIVLYNFISLDCPDNVEKCPIRLEWFKIKIYNELISNKGFDDVIVVSSFIDNVPDINKKIQQFRNHNKIQSDKWIMTSTKYNPFFDNDFQKGNPWNKEDSLYGFNKEAYLMTLLVDKNQNIRGKYLTYNFGEVRRITKEISLIIKEEQQNKSKTEKLPVLGQKEFIPNLDEDTIFHTVPYWEFQNQSGLTISSESVDDKIHVVDFFFTNCPTICPKKTVNIKKIQETIQKKCIPNVEFLSFSVDPESDSIEKLRYYAMDYEVNTLNWNFLTGDKDDIYELGVKGYLLPCQEDPSAEGGFLHSEKIILVDKKSRLRAQYDGTNYEDLKRIVSDIQLLQEE
ncbi:MAG: hypothetical protein CL846_08850 [Crocinitomicaceae bacterium]|nr:hypothetical protein [Crocinitomicaceae bacterium]|tara:strand:+ start:29539 stop:30741 length:1203 start_codon:yes stop_codon:yes gene_type:complete